jgi:undecaprenyl diphosphate synthase
MTTKNIPQHIGIIMDGNRRWAKRKGLPTLKGHEKGYEMLKKVGEWCLDRGVKFLTVFAFSTENWNRSPEEVDYLMKLLKKALKDEVKEMHKKGFRINVIGRMKDLSKDLQQAVKDAVELTKDNKKGTINIALNYGGRAEIVDMAKAIVKAAIQGHLSPRRITEKLITNYLYTKGIPDPDLIIRTSGEQRLSGFLPWQSSYAELYFTPTCWPDFSEKELDKAIDWYLHRERRFGGS